MDALILLGSFIALILIGMPVAYALGLSALIGAWWIDIPFQALMIQVAGGVNKFSLLAIPFFVLAGAIMAEGGMSRRLVAFAGVLVGFVRGGLSLVNIMASTFFGAISGSSVADTASVGSVLIPEMERRGYPREFATAVTVSGSVQALLTPPSHNSVLYSLAAGGTVSIASLFMAGVVPGLLAVTMYVITIAVLVRLKPDLLPAGAQTSWKQRFQGLKEVWAPLALFVFVIGGLYGGLFTPTEAGGMGAGGAFLLGLARGKLSRAQIREALLQATRTSAAVFTVLIGALLFGYFLTVTQTPQHLTSLLAGLGLGKYGVLALIMAMYLLLGCLMDAMAMIILTVPIIFPVITGLGFDPIWFGIIIVMTVELGLIHPPVGMNVFVIKSVVKDVSFSTIFKGVIPFVITDLIRLLILIAFPVIALYLPQHMGR